MSEDESPPRHRIVVTPADADIDELRHVSNLVYLRWVLQVARAHSDAVGWDHDAYERLGSIWVVRRHEIDYATPALRDDTISVTTWVDSFKRVSCVRRTELRRMADDRVVCQAATTWAFVRTSDGRPTRIPEHVAAPFAAGSRNHTDVRS